MYNINLLDPFKFWMGILIFTHLSLMGLYLWARDVRGLWFIPGTLLSIGSYIQYSKKLGGKK